VKKLICLILLFGGLQVSAAELHLSPGESQDIGGMTVVCDGNGGGGFGMCQGQINGLTQLIQACEKTYDGAYCVDHYWPSFKAQNPNCALSAIQICIDGCEKTYDGAYCADHCSK